MSPAFASLPLPTIRSLLTSFVGAGPLGGVTFGSVASGPLVGVVAAAVSVLFASASSDLFSTPTPIPLSELLPPQPAIRPAAASTARPANVRERARVSRGMKSLKLVTVAQPNGVSV